MKTKKLNEKELLIFLDGVTLGYETAITHIVIDLQSGKRHFKDIVKMYTKYLKEQKKKRCKNANKNKKTT